MLRSSVERGAGSHVGVGQKKIFFARGSTRRRWPAGALIRGPRPWAMGERPQQCARARPVARSEVFGGTQTLDLQKKPFLPGQTGNSFYKGTPLLGALIALIKVRSAQGMGPSRAEEERGDERSRALA